MDRKAWKSMELNKKTPIWKNLFLKFWRRSFKNIFYGDDLLLKLLCLSLELHKEWAPCSASLINLAKNYKRNNVIFFMQKNLYLQNRSASRETFFEIRFSRSSIHRNVGSKGQNLRLKKFCFPSLHWSAILFWY